MGWYSPDPKIRDELAAVFTTESMAGQSETNTLIEWLNDVLPEYEQCEQPAAAFAALDGMLEHCNRLRWVIANACGCKYCKTLSVPLQGGLCPDCREKLSGMRIKCAAILYRGNQYYVGKRHHEIGATMIEQGVCSPPYPSGDAQGFVTECGRFLTREAAWCVAVKAGQIDPDKATRKGVLFSEDLDSTSNKEVE